MNKKRNNSLVTTLSTLLSKPKSRKNRPDLAIKTTNLSNSDKETVSKPKVTTFGSEDSIFTASPLDPNRPSVAETLLAPQDDYQHALDIIKIHITCNQKKSFKQRLSNLRVKIKPREETSVRVDAVNEYVPSANEQFQIHLQQEFQKEIIDAQKDEFVREEELIVHRIEGEDSRTFFRSEGGVRVIDLVRSRAKDWGKGQSMKTIDTTDRSSIYFNKTFVKQMKRLGLNNFAGSRFKGEAIELPEIVAQGRAERVGVHVDDLITKIKSDTAFKQEIIQNNYPNQLVYKSLFGDITAETEKYFVVPENEDGYENEEGVASDIASVHVKIVDGDSSSIDSSEKEHPLQRDFFPGEYQEFERSAAILHKRGVSEGFNTEKLTIGARQLLKLNNLLDGTKPILGPSQLHQLQHVLVDDGGAIRVRKTHARHNSSPTSFSPNDLRSVVSYLFPSITKEALLIDGVTAKAMEDFNSDFL